MPCTAMVATGTASGSSECRGRERYRDHEYSDHHRTQTMDSGHVTSSHLEASPARTDEPGSSLTIALLVGPCDLSHVCSFACRRRRSLLSSGT
jgi:hypothetical protein